MFAFHQIIFSIFLTLDVLSMMLILPLQVCPIATSGMSQLVKPLSGNFKCPGFGSTNLSKEEHGNMSVNTELFYEDQKQEQNNLEALGQVFWHM